jgi:hypothetical protein
MPPEAFLHERADFKALVETVAAAKNIHDPALVEKDYWIMHALFGLKQLGLAFELKGGTSLSKGFGLIHRFSEDIDIRIERFDRFALDSKLLRHLPAPGNRRRAEIHRHAGISGAQEEAFQVHGPERGGEWRLHTRCSGYPQAI